MSKPLPIIEIFGPTLQGEGPLIGYRTMFVRFGGCNYRCSWCDTLYAVLPEEVKANATWMTPEQIAKTIQAYREFVPWVTFSGGNPCIHNLTDLITHLHWGLVAYLHRDARGPIKGTEMVLATG